MKKEIIKDVKGFINRCRYYASSGSKDVSSYNGGVVIWEYDVKADSTSGCVELTKKETNELLLVICFEPNVVGDGWSYRLITTDENRSTMCVFSDGMSEWMLEKESAKPEAEIFYSIINEYC